MANNYFQFSFILPLETKKERVWLTKFFTEKPDGFWTADQVSDCEDVEDRCVGFSHEFEGDDDVVIFAEETGDTEQVVQILKKFLLESGTKLAQVGFSYAYTCSSMRPGEFGGGALLVKKTARGCKVEYTDTAEWLAKKGHTK